MTATLSTVDIKQLRSAPWSTTFLLRPDERLLADSLTEHGWLVPLVVRRDGLVIDGNQRLRIASNDRAVAERVGSEVPVSWVQCDEVDAMVMHMRLNRAKGMTVAKGTSLLLNEVLASRKYTEETLRKMLRMTPEEFQVLHDAEYLKRSAIAGHQYSYAWVPIEAPKPGDVVAGIKTDRPVNPDN